MRITKLHINHYKSLLRPFHLEKPGNIHIFIGPNNTGKTNILDALTQLYSEDDLRLLDNNSDINIEFKLRSKYGKLLIVEQKNSQKKFILDGKKIEQVKAEAILKHHLVRLCAMVPHDMPKLQMVYDEFYHNYPDLFKIFHDTLLKYFPEINTTEKFLKTTSIQEFGSIRPFERLGAGFQQIFVMLMFLFHPEYTVLLLEEPEIHLHPALIKKLLTVFERENLDNQIFLTTHSPLFIHPNNLHRVFRVIRENESTVVYSPRLQGKNIDYSRLTQEMNADNCEMFFADKVLLVEGPSDHILMRGLIDRFYRGAKEIKVIQVYGKSNIDIYSELLEMFQIPYAVLLDQDAMKDVGLNLIQSHIKDWSFKTEKNLVLMLKRHDIFVLPNGSIEKNYPLKYQRHHKHKPLNAFHAANKITLDEYQSPLMKNIREVIENL
jgi:predicted ATP-dependent endonuclease of OLD family